MKTAPKSMRLHIGVLGRVNVGKSSVINFIIGQDVSIVSPLKGTTTDIVEKTMELLPLGPVVFLDTAGFEDESELGNLRMAKTLKLFERIDAALIVTEAGEWGECEEGLLKKCKEKSIYPIVLVNKTDLKKPSEEFLSRLKHKNIKIFSFSAKNPAERNSILTGIKNSLYEALGEKKEKKIIADLIKPQDTAIFIIPIDKEAPKGRIILPQVQAMRDMLDAGCLSLVVREKEYLVALKALSHPPKLVVCDSQVADFMVKNTPAEIMCTTFSILFSRFKGDINKFAFYAGSLESLRPKDRVLVLEACSHHPIEDDIGRVKMPKWLKEKVGGDLKIDTFSGRDIPEDLSVYKAIIQCGGCMLTEKDVSNRLNKAEAAGIPITNYGMAIAWSMNAMERVLSPFEKALKSYKEGLKFYGGV